MADLLQRLRERKLVQWALAYAAAAWVLLQVLSLMAGTYEWPPVAMRIAVAVAVLGFFVAIVLAWYHGERGAQRISGVELVILGLLLAIGGTLLSRVARLPGGETTTAPVVTRVGSTTKTPVTPTPSAIPIRDKSVAVLPFENMSADANNAYFASGMRDEILTRLSAIRDLKVISRTSTEQYGSHPTDVRTVADQLGVAAVLEGSVQKAGDSAHINVQLIDTRSDTHLWADSYDRDLKNIFAVERDVAEKVAEALKAHLLPDEQARVASAPTQNPEAFDLFLRGNAHFLIANDEYALTATEVPQAIPLLEQALEKDPKFALAASALAKAHMYAFWFLPDRTDARLAAAKEMAERALGLQPDLGDGHYALGLYLYWGHRDYAAAREQFALARMVQPNDSDVEVTDAAIARRQGRLDDAMAGFKRASVLAPRGAGSYFNLAQCYMELHQYAESDRLFARAAEVSLDPGVQLIRRGENTIYWKGDLGPMRGALQALKLDSDLYRTNGLRLQLLAWLSRDFAGSAKASRQDTSRNWYDATNISLPRELYLAWAYARAGEDGKAKSLYSILRGDLLKAVAERPDDADRHLALAFAEAGLGNKQEAIAQGRKAVEIMPVSRDAFAGPGYLTWQAKLYAQLGETDKAFEVIERLLGMPSGHSISGALLRIDPFWDPLRGDPRLEQLAARADSLIRDGSHG